MRRSRVKQSSPRVRSHEVAIERATLISRLIKIQCLIRITVAMQVSRLIKRGVLKSDGRLVSVAEITKSQNHTITGGGGCVISVTKCDKCDEG